jgi:hypothetical protein
VNGELENIGAGKWRLRFTRALAYSPETVWRALTRPDQLKAWFPDGISGEFSVGSTLTFGSSYVGEFTGQVLASTRRSRSNTPGAPICCGARSSRPTTAVC